MHNRKREQKERLMRDVCQRLSIKQETYDYKEVRQEIDITIEKRRKVGVRYGDSVGNITVGFLIPSCKEIIFTINSAPWSCVAIPGDKHHPTRFSYQEVDVEPRKGG